MPNITGAPGEVTINQRVFIMSPITDKDVGELNNWLRGRMLSAARASIPEGSPDEEKIMDQAMRSALKMDWMANRHLMTSPEHLLRMLWQLMRKEQPNLTSEEFSRELLADPAALTRCRDTFRLLHPLLVGAEEGLAKNSEPARKPNKPTTEQRSTRRSSKKQERKNRKKNRPR